jgi:Holliday junction DNA helicase RuvA
VICRLTGLLAHVGAESVVVDVQGVGYEVLVPGSDLPALTDAAGRELTLHTVQYLEGNPAGANLTPRLVGFLDPSAKTFFGLFTRVKGISMRRALRAMCLPVAQLAAAIEQGDVRTLQSLPEIGKKTASQVVSDLRGKLTELAAGMVADEAATPVGELSEAQRLAVEILVQWGDRRVDAERWVARAVDEDPTLSGPDAIVSAAYRRRMARRE